MFQPGQVIKDTYRIERRLGAGGMAEVDLVSHTRFPRQFALKLMLHDMGEKKVFLERFRREAEILAKLRHPHIVDVTDWDYVDGRPFLVMEYLEGETLDAFLRRTGPLSLPVALDIATQIGQALDSAHAAGIIHRDLKPSNIFLDKNGSKANFVKILDFGIAKITHVEKTPLTAQSAIMGTPGYMAPEQALGQTGDIDHRTDQFALATILYEMLIGHPLFYTPGEAVYTILARIVSESVPPLPYEPLNQVIQKALSKKREDRFPSLQAFLAALRGNNMTLALPPAPPPVSTLGSGEASRPALPSRRRGLPLVLGGGYAHSPHGSMEDLAALWLPGGCEAKQVSVGRAIYSLLQEARAQYLGHVGISRGIVGLASVVAVSRGDPELRPAAVQVPHAHVEHFAGPAAEQQRRHRRKSHGIPFLVEHPESGADESLRLIEAQLLLAAAGAPDRLDALEGALADVTAAHGPAEQRLRQLEREALGCRGRGTARLARRRRDQVFIERRGSLGGQPADVVFEVGAQPPAEPAPVCVSALRATQAALHLVLCVLVEDRAE